MSLRIASLKMPPDGHRSSGRQDSVLTNSSLPSTEDAMRAICWSITGIFGFFLGACTSIQTTPAPETRQALAPSGKLRVGFLVTTPLHATKDPASGELTGPAADLGREMARRLGVPFEPVAYTSFPPVLAGARSGQWDIAMMGITSDREQIVDFTAPYMVV
ncbi:MAG: transporter substrate-binding domain-containing protein, partial [Burkholderiales bacterium]